MMMGGRAEEELKHSVKMERKCADDDDEMSNIPAVMQTLEGRAAMVG